MGPGGKRAHTSADLGWGPCPAEPCPLHRWALIQGEKWLWLGPRWGTRPAWGCRSQGRRTPASSCARRSSSGTSRGGTAWPAPASTRSSASRSCTGCSRTTCSPASRASCTSRRPTTPASASPRNSAQPSTATSCGPPARPRVRVPCLALHEPSFDSFNVWESNNWTWFCRPTQLTICYLS